MRKRLSIIMLFPERNLPPELLIIFTLTQTMPGFEERKNAGIMSYIKQLTKINLINVWSFQQEMNKRQLQFCSERVKTMQWKYSGLRNNKQKCFICFGIQSSIYCKWKCLMCVYIIIAFLVFSKHGITPPYYGVQLVR